jgi:hypothetical protein
LPLELSEATATLIDVVSVDDVEELAAWLRATEKPKVNLKRCTHLHTGALQAMLLFRPKVTAAPADTFLADQVLPLIAGSRQRSDPP